METGQALGGATGRPTKNANRKEQPRELEPHQKMAD